MGKLWGGRFDENDLDPKVMDFSSSLQVDRELAEYDCASTIVHVEMLGARGILAKEEQDELVDVLKGLLARIQKGEWEPSGHEDIHSAIQEYIEKAAPVSSRKMHTGRSRNEQVVNDVRLYCRDNIDRVSGLIKAFQKQLVLLAERNPEAIIPGYTHLNRAQPVLFAHLLMSYVEMLSRDAERFDDAGKRCDVSVMGSGALAGSALELDREFSARRSGFSAVHSNSMDAVSDRDFMAEAVWCLAMTAVHLSRICEDLILYSIPEFGFIEIGSAYCTGSSLMPQKRNPDVLELVRGRSASVISDLNSLLVLQKALPHTYNRDLQEDKAPLFRSFATVKASLEMMAGLVGTVTYRETASMEALDNEFIYATDIAEYLVGKGVAFKDAHDIVGAMVKKCSEKGMNISDLSISDLKAFSEELDEGVYALLNARVSVRNKKTPGSTNPKMVSSRVAEWKKKLK
ncbi:MAG: argininosuccinate lyase [Candidatus Omnitrophica bacterium]|nr:argininosuccinate lyase [Candidatus Omnitrophota bacterium]